MGHAGCFSNKGRIAMFGEVYTFSESGGVGFWCWQRSGSGWRDGRYRGCRDLGLFLGFPITAGSDGYGNAEQGDNQ